MEDYNIKEELANKSFELFQKLQKNEITQEEFDEWHEKYWDNGII